MWLKVECELEKYSINNLIPHLSWLNKLSPHSYTSPHIHLWIFKPYELLFLGFEPFVKYKIWIVKRKSLNNLSVTWHGLGNFPHSYPCSHIHLRIFGTLWVIIFLVWVICKWLNANWEKIDPVILCFTCHSLINFSPIIHIPSYPFVNFQNPMSHYFLSLSHL